MTPEEERKAIVDQITGGLSASQGALGRIEHLRVEPKRAAYEGRLIRRIEEGGQLHQDDEDARDEVSAGAAAL